MNPVPVDGEAGWASGPILTCLEMRKSPTGNRPPVRPTCSVVAIPTRRQPLFNTGLCKHINVFCSLVRLVGNRYLPCEQELLLSAYCVSLTLRC